MVIDNDKKSNRKLYITIGCVGAAVVMLIGFSLVFSNVFKKDKAYESTEIEQLKQVIKDNRIAIEGVSKVDEDTGEVTIDESALKKVSEEKVSDSIISINQLVSSKDTWFKKRTENLSGEEKKNYYKERTDTGKLPDSFDESKDEDLESKIKTIIQVDMYDLQQRLDASALHDEFTITNESLYKGCQSEDAMGKTQAECGISYKEDKDYLGDEYSANILGGAIYAYQENALDQITGLDNLTWRQIINNVCYWLEVYKHPTPFHYEIDKEGSMFKNAIMYGYWKELDYTKIENLVIKEASGKAGDFYDKKYNASFSIDGKWYKAILVEKDMDLKVYDILSV